MYFSNADKQKHGQSSKDSLENLLEGCRELNYLSKITKPFRLGKEGYSNSSQFYAPFMIEFQDGTKWILFTTTSMRTDRIKGQQWDALNLKQIDTDISAAYIVYPDGIEGSIKSEFIRQNSKYENCTEYSAIDAIISQDRISNLIEQYALRNMTDGQKRDAMGNNFECRIATILAYKGNLAKWKNDDATREGMHYDIYSSILSCFELDKDTTESIEATSDKNVIGQLPTGGNPKTDVLVRVTDINGTTQNYTISCKRSSGKSVSVHQYPADTFADVLDPHNEELRRLLNLFQSCGNKRDIGEENASRLTRVIAPYVEKLSLWVLGGYGGAGNPNIHWASYIVTYDNNDSSTSVYRTNEYYEKLISEGSSGSFGTPFSWTYQGKRGTNIQLKCKILK